EVSPDKNAGLPDTTAGFTVPSFGHESFAVMCPLALLGIASYPVSVRRPVGSFPASFGPGLAAGLFSLAVPLGPCDQVPGGLSPPSQRPCWAYTRARPPAPAGGPTRLTERARRIGRE